MKIQTSSAIIRVWSAKGQVRFNTADSMPGQLDAKPTGCQANLIPSQLDAKIYNLTFKLLFINGVGDKLAASSLPDIKSAASSWWNRLGGI